MAKIECNEFPKEIKKCIKKPHVDVIKTRKNGKDTYIYEVTAEGVPTFVLDHEETRPAGNYPDLEDTWCGGKWPGEKYNGCDYDINIFDKSVYGDDDGECGLTASVCSCYQEGDYPSTNSDDCVKATVTCWFQNSKGKRTEFKCSNGEHFLERFGEWDGKPILEPTRPSKKVFDKAYDLAKKLSDFLVENNLEIHYDMASDKVYLLPEKGWDDATREEVEKVMEASGNILDPKTEGKKWGWVRGSYIDDNWFCNKGGK